MPENLHAVSKDTTFCVLWLPANAIDTTYGTDTWTAEVVPKELEQPMHIVWNGSLGFYPLLYSPFLLKP